MKKSRTRNRWTHSRWSPMRFTGNGITNCYPDQVEDFISITVLTILPPRRSSGSPPRSRSSTRWRVSRCVFPGQRTSQVAREHAISEHLVAQRADGRKPGLSPSLSHVAPSGVAELSLRLSQWWSSWWRRPRVRGWRRTVGTRCRWAGPRSDRALGRAVELIARLASALSSDRAGATISSSRRCAAWRMGWAARHRSTSCRIWPTASCTTRPYGSVASPTSRFRLRPRRVGARESCGGFWRPRRT